MKRLSKRRSISKTRPARQTDEPEDEEITTQTVKFASLLEPDEAVDEHEQEQEQEDEAGHTLMQKHKKILKFSSIKNGVNNQQQQQQQQEKFICSQCGKGFQSLKARCGHMACHSEKEKAPTTTNLVAKQNVQTMDDSQSDTESGAQRLTRRSRRAIRYKKHNSVAVVTSKAAKVDVFKNCSSEDSEVEQELADVAINLMLLSRDSANWGGLNSVGDSSDNNSVVLEARSVSTKLAQKDALSNVHLMDEASMKFATVLGDPESLKVTEFDEGSKTEPHLSLRKLKRAFDAGLIRDDEVRNQSKRPKMDLSMTKSASNEPYMAGNFKAASPYERGGNSFETDAALDTRKGKGILRHHSSNVGDKSKKGKHECQVCFKVFKSGQALGGHRRVHSSEESDEIKRDEVSANFKQNETQLHHFIDLNLPAPIEDDEASDSMARYH